MDYNALFHALKGPRGLTRGVTMVTGSHCGNPFTMTKYGQHISINLVPPFHILLPAEVVVDVGKFALNKLVYR
jgi:hypothetical protein